MKIGSSFDSQAVGDRSGLKVDTKRGARAASGGESATQVQLSELSTKLAELESKLAASDAFDVEKVEAIKQAITAGHFKVDTDAVADKLLQNVRELLGRG